MAQGIFEDQDMGQVQGGASPSPAVQQAPSLTQSFAQSGAIQSLGGLVEDLVAGKQAQQQQQRINQQNTAMSGYAQKITNLNSGVAQGSIKQADAQRMQRAAYNQLIANHPELTEKATSLNSSLAGSAGLGDTLSKGTAVDQALQDQKKAAASNNFITSDMTPQEQEQGLQQWLAHNRALDDMNFRSKQLGLQQQVTSIQAQQENMAYTRVQRANALADLKIKNNRVAVQGSVADFASGVQTQVTNQLRGIADQVRTGKMTNEQGMMQAQQLHDQFSQSLSQVRGAAGADYVDGIAKPIENVFTAYGGFISGKVQGDALQQQLQTQQISAQLPIMKDPEMAHIYGLSKLTGNLFQPVIQSLVSGHTMDLVKNALQGGPHGNVTPDNPQQQSGAKTYMDSIKHVWSSVTGGDPMIQDPKGTIQEVKSHANQVLGGISRFASSQENPSQLNNALDFLSSPEFLQIRKSGGGLDASAIAGATNAISINYNDKLIPTVQQEWRNNRTTTSVSLPAGGFPGAVGNAASSTDASTQNAVRYVWNGNSLVFSPAAGYERNQGAIAKAKYLQQKVAPLINRQVRVAAHLDGSDNYTKYFHQEEQAYFGDPASTPDVPQE